MKTTQYGGMFDFFRSFNKLPTLDPATNLLRTITRGVQGKRQATQLSNQVRTQQIVAQTNAQTAERVRQAQAVSQMIAAQRAAEQAAQQQIYYPSYPGSIPAGIPIGAPPSLTTEVAPAQDNTGMLLGGLAVLALVGGGLFLAFGRKKRRAA